MQIFQPRINQCRIIEVSFSLCAILSTALKKKSRSMEKKLKRSWRCEKKVRSDAACTPHELRDFGVLSLRRLKENFFATRLVFKNKIQIILLACSRVFVLFSYEFLSIRWNIYAVLIVYIYIQNFYDYKIFNCQCVKEYFPVEIKKKKINIISIEYCVKKLICQFCLMCKVFNLPMKIS